MPFLVMSYVAGLMWFCSKIRLFSGWAIRKLPYRCVIVTHVDMRAASMHLRVEGECILLMSWAFWKSKLWWCVLRCSTNALVLVSNFRSLLCSYILFLSCLDVSPI